MYAKRSFEAQANTAYNVQLHSKVRDSRAPVHDTGNACCTSASMHCPPLALLENYMNLHLPLQTTIQILKGLFKQIFLDERQILARRRIMKDRELLCIIRAVQKLFFPNVPAMKILQHYDYTEVQRLLQPLKTVIGERTGNFTFSTFIQNSYLKCSM